MRRPFIIGVTTTAPTMPVSTTKTAVKVGDPPSDWLIPSATGAVVLLGASVASIWGDRPSARPKASAVTMAVNDPASRAAAMGKAARRTVARCAQSGTARDTVAGPSRKCTNCAPSKYVS